MITIQSVSKSFGSRLALQNINLELAQGQTHVFLGSSGSGKTTLLRLLCGLVDVSSGKILINALQASSQVQRKLAMQIGYVIQEGGLFPHLSARNNISLTAQVQNWSEDKINARVSALAQLVQLEESVLDRYPKELSGGQRQRLALMRALMLDPPILLLDEPLGALDPLVRSELQRELKRIFNHVKKTVVIVTHDVGEGAFFGHTISLFHEGILLQHGNFSSFVKKPKSDFVTRFINAQIPVPELLEGLR